MNIRPRLLFDIVTLQSFLCRWLSRFWFRFNLQNKILKQYSIQVATPFKEDEENENEKQKRDEDLSLSYLTLALLKEVRLKNIYF